jgi:hypothetical protein
MFQLSAQEFADLKSQIVTSSWGGLRRALSYAFTEQGVAMLSSVLRSPRAIHVNIAIMRAFVRLREMLAGHKELALRLEELEKKYDAQFKVVFDAIRALMQPAHSTAKRRIGFAPPAGVPQVPALPRKPWRGSAAVTSRHVAEAKNMEEQIASLREQTVGLDSDQLCGRTCSLSSVRRTSANAALIWPLVNGITVKP